MDARGPVVSLLVRPDSGRLCSSRGRGPAVFLFPGLANICEKSRPRCGGRPRQPPGPRLPPPCAAPSAQAWGGSGERPSPSWPPPGGEATCPGPGPWVTCPEAPSDEEGRGTEVRRTGHVPQRAGPRDGGGEGSDIPRTAVGTPKYGPATAVFSPFHIIGKTWGKPKPAGHLRLRGHEGGGREAGAGRPGSGTAACSAPLGLTQPPAEPGLRRGQWPRQPSSLRTYRTLAGATSGGAGAPGTRHPGASRYHPTPRAVGHEMPLSPKAGSQSQLSHPVCVPHPQKVSRTHSLYFVPRLPRPCPQEGSAPISLLHRQGNCSSEGSRDTPTLLAPGSTRIQPPPLHPPLLGTLHLPGTSQAPSCRGPSITPSQLLPWGRH